ncbi:hypothetical protein [Acidianus ambivalens]|uniref:DUF973 family protein n=1 Tax=Acidianus ambivalens TaxID=2283 RepID=A0A650CVL0_ACIAM|nr:hypothetical protein [Acidianus ambivalens]MQL55523.1 hypothetical protein [Acidianus ambivalens]QGR21889.1 hypothetical protein D1866_07645 [Acidianus ambivalens]
MIVQKTKKSKKGLSGAITALILVIASVIIALVVVFFAFGYLGAFTSTPTVSEAGYGTISGSTLKVTLVSSGNVNIIGIEYGANSVSASKTLTAGTNVVCLSISGLGITPVPGQEYSFTLVLSDGGTVTVTATAS